MFQHILRAIMTVVHFLFINNILSDHHSKKNKKNALNPLTTPCPSLYSMKNIQKVWLQWGL